MRWRRRHGGRFAALKPREYIPKAEMWTKARDTIFTNISPQQPSHFSWKKKKCLENKTKQCVVWRPRIL